MDFTRPLWVGHYRLCFTLHIVLSCIGTEGINMHSQLIVRPKKINYMFFRHRPRHLQPPASKMFIAFPVFTLKNHLYIVNCHFRSAVIFCHFVWLVRILKVKIFSGIYSDTSFYSISFNKIKNCPPASISKKSA